MHTPNPPDQAETPHDPADSLRGRLRGVPTRRWVLLGITLLALALRVGFFVELRDHPLIDLPLHPIGSQTDNAFYWEWSGEVLAGDLLGRDTPHPQYGWMDRMGTHETWLRWWGGPQIYQSEPFYPYALAALRAVGLDLYQIILLQLVGGAFAPALLYAAAKRWIGAPAALWAAGVLAVHGTLIFYTGALLRDWVATLTDPLLLCLLAWAASAAARWSPRWLLAGVAAGAMLWIKSTIQLFLPLALLWTLLHRGPREARSRWPAVLLLLLGISLGLSPLIARNLAVDAPPLALSNRPIEGFAVANPASNRFPVGFSHDAEASARILEAGNGSTSRVILETLKTYRGDPTQFLSNQWTKFRALVDPFEVPNNLSPDFGRREFPILRWLPGWGTVLPLAVVGVAVVGLRHPRNHSLLLLYGLASFAAVMTLLVLARYRMVLLPFLAIYAGVALDYVVTTARARRPGPVLLWTGALAVAVGLQWFVLPLPQLRQDLFMVTHPLSYNASIQIVLERDEPLEAIAILSRWRDAGQGLPPSQVDLLNDSTRYREAEIYFRAIGWKMQRGQLTEAAEFAATYGETRDLLNDPELIPPIAVAWAEAKQWSLAAAAAEAYLADPARQQWRDIVERVLIEARARLPEPPTPRPTP